MVKRPLHLHHSNDRQVHLPVGLPADRLKYPPAAETSEPCGKTFQAAEVLVQKERAATLRKSVEGGVDATNKGETARKPAGHRAKTTSSRKEDLASYEVTWQEPAIRSEAPGPEGASLPLNSKLLTCQQTPALESELGFSLPSV